jgi:GntR family transcriptional regulator
MRQRGLAPSYRVLSVETPEAGQSVAAALSIDPASRVLALRRLLLADDIPMALEEAYLPQERFPGIAQEDFTMSLYDILRAHYGRYMRSTRRTIRAVQLGAEQAGLLETHEGAAALVVIGTTSDPYGMPMEHFTTTFRGDRYEFDLTIRADR